MAPKVTVLIPTYNRRETLLSRSLKSALKLKGDYEIIVCDDGSDDTEEAIKPYLDRVKYLKNPVDCGQYANVNFGIAEAKGKYIVILDDDNELMPNFLQETLANIGDLDALGVGRVIQYQDFAHTVIPKLSKFTSMDWGWLIRREVFDSVQYDGECKANGDADFGIRFEKAGFIRGVLPKPLCVAYDQDGDPTKSTSFPSKRELDGMEYFLKKNLKEYDDPNELRYLYRLMGRKFYRGGRKLRGLYYFWKSFFAYPRFNSLAHLVAIHFGWFFYDKFMTITEKHA